MTQKKVLIVDDSKLMRIIIKKILSTDDIFIVTVEAGNGIEALAEFEKDIPDIIFLDIEMPEMGSSRAAEVNQLGADAIIEKPGGAVDPTLASQKGKEFIEIARKVLGL